MKPIEDPSKFIEDILKVHNEYRAIHGSPLLRIDEKLNERAQQLAKSLSKKREEEVFEEAIPYGENIYVSFARDLNWKMQPEEPVQYWYEESRYYNYDAPRPRNVKHVRNFTQLVWKDSKLMGSAIVTDSSGKVYLVCSYDPAANIDGNFQRNVAPPREEDIQVASLEEMELTFTEPSEEVMRTMLRLYAVPSEKLRVWMVWLTSVAEIADEWHKWLRAHIDLIARIAERLQMAADHVPGGRRIESTVNAKYDKIPDNVMPAETKKEGASPDLFDGT
ncbi:Golgi-associated plant pathogenesis-related protein 1-like isoform X2 [Linepithema humile]|uniref:Golgi-associated plant pathogenesis-related protein 1-like isoform X2 n=1 Tax=Linepithema humile TaxID=83485 RepID=UPI00351F5D6D